MKKPIDVAVVITAYNEEDNIESAIRSAQKLTSEIILVDTESTDRTASIAQKLGCKVYSFPYNTYVEPSRKFSIGKAKASWVFILDADERFTEELIEEIYDVIKNSSATYFKIPRRNIFAGQKWLKYGGWYPDHVIRLIKKDNLVSWPKEIHSAPIIKGDGGFLRSDLLHYFHPNLENMVRKTVIFEEVESELLFKANKNSSTVIFFRKFFGEFNRRMVLKMGFIDGVHGIIESMYQAFSKTITYLMLYEKNQKKSSVV